MHAFCFGVKKPFKKPTTFERSDSVLKLDKFTFLEILFHSDVCLVAFLEMDMN